MDEDENFFCQFPYPWALRVSAVRDGLFTSKGEKSQNHRMHRMGQREELRSGTPIQYLNKKGAMDRSLAHPQVKLSLLLSNSLKFQPKVGNIQGPKSHLGGGGAKEENQ